MKKLIIFSLIADLCLIVLFFILTRWLFSSAAFLAIIFLCFCSALLFEHYEQKLYRLVFIPTLLPAISFCGLDLLSLINSDTTIAWPWLYLSTILAYVLFSKLLNFFVLEDSYFRELKYSQGIGRRKLLAIVIANLIILSLTILVIIDHYE